MLSTATIDQIRDLPIEQVIGKYVTLKRSGSAWAACCPLHNENTPSFYVTPAKNIFKCFGCGAGGDAIAFVMLKENLSFIEACKHLASDNGIPIQETEAKGKTPEQLSDEAHMLQWVANAQVKYRKQLVETPSVIKYLYSRGLTRDSIIQWQFGVVPDWRVIAPDMMAAGKFAIGEACGLVKKGNANTWDVMHHRITIPIHNVRGQQIGFAGRTYQAKDLKADLGDMPKYINPPESPLYDKSKTLFGLNVARKHFQAHGMAVLVEGYFDVIQMHQAGWNNAVASCGTALTPGQAKTLKRYTDTVLILRDGDKAGHKAIQKDIPVLLAEQFNVYVCELPTKEDPDTLFCKPFECVVNTLWHWQDGIEYLCNAHFKSATNTTLKAKAIEFTCETLSHISSMVRRDQYVQVFSKLWKVKPADFTRNIAAIIQKRADEKLEKETTHADEQSRLPAWVDRHQLEVNGFVQLTKPTTDYKAGIYFINTKTRSLYSITNFTIAPLYHIYDQNNNRRLIEIDNTHRSAVVELPTQAMVNQGSFEAELMNKGNFMCNEFLARSEYKRLIAWMVNSMPIAYELKTLGWQPEGFFAYSNAVYINSEAGTGGILKYDELGMINVEGKHYMSLGNSKIHRDERQIDNPYENDLYLKLIEPREGINFETWARMFNDAYGPNAAYGIAFTFLTLFKDLVTRVTKMPLLYLYGQKGSGKSDMAESILWLFFSGKDAEHNLMRGFNLNPGQSTPFSFFNRVERFRNCPMLMNEFDENTIEPWKTGTMKAAYDGEGREVGDGDTGKKRKTKIQKVQGTIMLVGQYMATKDDAAVSSRSIPCNFSLERLKNLTPAQRQAHSTLKEHEREGLAFIITELLTHRPEVQKRLAKTYMAVQAGITEKMRSEGLRVEARLINNYSIMLAATQVLIDLGIKLPYTYNEFLNHATARMVSHNQTLKNNSIVGQWWKAVEVLFDKGMVNTSMLSIQVFPAGIDIKDGSHVTKVNTKGEVLLMRFSSVYAEYAKYHRERHGQAAQGEETVLMYLKEQTYFLGLTPVVSFSEKRTSAYAFNYEAMKELGIVLEKEFHVNGAHAPAAQQPTRTTQMQLPTDDVPF